VGYEMAFRPSGVTALAVIFIILAVLSAVGAIFIETVFIPQFQTSNYINLLSIPLVINFTAGLPPALAQFLEVTVAFVIGAPVMANLSYIPYLHVGVLIDLAIVPLLIIAAIGLFRMKQWGRYLGIIVGILIMISGVIPTIFATGGVFIILAGIIIVVYLYSVVKEDFEMR
jgi:hypothetical protein